MPDIKKFMLAALVAAGGVPLSGDIKMVFRSDGSGTSFAFSNHPSKVCGDSRNPPLGINGNGLATFFKTDQAFATVAAKHYFDANAYASTLGASGNQGSPDDLRRSEFVRRNRAARGRDL